MPAKTHGHSSKRAMTPTYVSWVAMKARCNNPNSAKFHRYGAAGVKVCREWNQSFETFLLDMGERPSLGHTLDRIDNAIGYQPGNVRWATAIEQGRNRTNNRLLTHRGKTQTLCEWAAEVGIHRRTVLSRLAAGKSVAEALTVPVRAELKPRRPPTTLTFHGKTQTLSAWSKETGMPVKVLALRVKQSNWTAEQILTTPVLQRGQRLPV